MSIAKFLVGALLTSSFFVMAACESKLDADFRDSKERCFQSSAYESPAYVAGCLASSKMAYECEKQYSDENEAIKCMTDGLETMVEDPAAFLLKYK